MTAHPTATAPLDPAIAADLGAAPGGDLRLDVDLGDGVDATAQRLRAECARSLAADGRALVVSSRPASDDALVRLRNALWPELHVARVYRTRAGGPVERQDVEARRAIGPPAGAPRGEGFVLVAVRREAALSPSFTQVKFDRNAAGWNGVPGSAGYGHFRWMRRLLSAVAPPRDGESVLDAGAGAGWVGIEAGLKARLSRLAAFDPSPEMVKLVNQNASEQGVAIDARVGFVEDPPFRDAADLFDVVYDSGVISFAPDPDRFVAGLDRMVKPGGRLVIGDLNPRSIGFERRRRSRPVLPSRELNGLTRAAICELLVRRGYRVTARRYYQLTWPVPEIAHRTASRALSALLLAANRVATQLDAALGSPFERLFDSWIVVAVKRA